MIALRNRQCDAARPFSFPSFHSGGALAITLMQLERVFEEAHKDAPRGAGQHRGAPSCRCPASSGPATPTTSRRQRISQVRNVLTQLPSTRTLPTTPQLKLALDTPPPDHEAGGIPAGTSLSSD
jgi:hypothetical protein